MAVGDHAGNCGPQSAACVTGNDAPLIVERAATRGRSAAEGGYEHAGVKKAAAVAPPTVSNLSARRQPRDQGRTLVDEPAGRRRIMCTRPPSSPARCAVDRRTSRNAGALRWNVRRYAHERPKPQRPRRTTRPGRRTLVEDLRPDVGCRAWRRHVGTATLDWMSVSRPHSAVWSPATSAVHRRTRRNARIQPKVATSTSARRAVTRSSASSRIRAANDATRDVHAIKNWRVVIDCQETGSQNGNLGFKENFK